MTERKLYKRNPDYLSNDDLLKEIIISKQQKKLTDKAFNMLVLMAKRINRKFRYDNEMDRDDVLQYSYENLLKRWHNFDEKKYINAFSYYTELIKRSHTMQYNLLMRDRKGTVSIHNFYNDGEDMNI